MNSNQKPTLHLLMGLPGAGKTTLARALQQATGAARITSDEYRLNLFPEPTFSQAEHDNLYAMIDHNVEHLLQSGQSVIYDANLNRLEHRREKYKIAEKYDADVRLWWVKTDKELAKQRRTQEQDELLLPEDETSEQLFERIAETIEAPQPDEAYTEVTGQNITPNSIQQYLN